MGGGLLTAAGLGLLVVVVVTGAGLCVGCNVIV